MMGAPWSVVRPCMPRMLRQMAAAVLEALWPRLSWPQVTRGPSFVLDLGCGPGDVTALELLPRLPPGVLVVAADCATLLPHTADKFQGPRLCFLELDLSMRRIRDTGVWRLAPYSKVFSFFSLQWVQHQRRAVRSISELLCTGGEVALMLVSRTGLFEMFENLSKSPKWSSYLTDYKLFLSPYQFLEEPKDELNMYLEDAGFTVEACCENEVVYVTEEEFEVKEMMTALNPFLGTIPEDEREVFILDCEEEAFKSGGMSVIPGFGGKQRYTLTYKALVAHAIKN